MQLTAAWDLGRSAALPALPEWHRTLRGEQGVDGQRQGQPRPRLHLPEDILPPAAAALSLLSLSPPVQMCCILLFLIFTNLQFSVSSKEFSPRPLSASSLHPYC